MLPARKTAASTPVVTHRTVFKSSSTCYVWSLGCDIWLTSHGRER